MYFHNFINKSDEKTKNEKWDERNIKVLTVFLPDVGHRCIESLFQHIEEIAFVQKEIWMEFADTVWQYLSYNVNQIFKIASSCAGR